ncbi:sugar ABC transporter ATP-binding protein [Treponema phagedenis]|uniref:sugar ABC transporter ATP-binding protein n=1 Tax=Treponema phagedenis TaxID=162 RepID=UPI0004630376|nr:sugar ABC transporter ATP-binding protein [Treponema phagedenis]NVP22740.1 sugar ABC transporter ATP-binding protein [Treponema phagedenis]QEK06170.1 sugar ABC transporter ATP-binding protein [Treponema phagedenis]QLC57646.1 sugar ABC transporter ATP-binding protein [Treponema phagedenis]QSH93668.1 sugar ABC transporter ATP-binding protein [Treponema phagedenis]
MTILMKDVIKRFGSVKVLHKAQFELADSEVHALVGENGAGKSTLMNCLTGTVPLNGGEIFIDGEKRVFKQPIESEQAGIIFIRQELNVFPEMTVEENLFIGKEITARFGFTDSAAMQEKAKKVLAKLGADISVRERVKNLSIGQQQILEIARALLSDAKVLIMDEPTAALTAHEVTKLFEVIRLLKQQGVSVIYISHRMEEIFELSDRITVLRDGQYIGTVRTKDTDMQSIIKMMIGREIGDRFPKESNPSGETVLEVKNLTKAGLFSDVSFTVRAGEVLGVAGLMGAGRTEIMKSIFGSIIPDSGTVVVGGKEARIRSPADAKKLGIGYITEDRKTEGLVLSESIKKNISLNNLAQIARRFGFIRSELEKEKSAKAIQSFKIKCAGADAACTSLSGGNQQKVVFAKWVEQMPRILILDEPTRGVDVGAKKEIYYIINNLAKQGMAIIMISSELPEVLGMSDKIMVVHEGKITGIVPAAEASQEKIMTLATGGTV